jgi:hypothetical protein
LNHNFISRRWIKDTATGANTAFNETTFLTGAQASLPANASMAGVSTGGNFGHARPAGNDVCAPVKGINLIETIMKRMSSFAPFTYSLATLVMTSENDEIT